MDKKKLELMEEADMINVKEQILELLSDRHFSFLATSSYVKGDIDQSGTKKELRFRDYCRRRCRGRNHEQIRVELTFMFFSIFFELLLD